MADPRESPTRYQAPRSARAVSAVVDQVIWVAFFAAALEAAPESIARVHVIAAACALRIAVPTLLLSRSGERNGVTPVKGWFGLRVFSDDGQPLRWPKALLRVVTAFLFTLVCPLLFISAAQAFFGSRRLAAHDEIAGTAVLRTATPAVHVAALADAHHERAAAAASSAGDPREAITSA
jgi:uncharacterized RDD family membrane protein YckC